MQPAGSEADWDPNFADNGGYGPFIGHYVYSLLSPPFDWRRDINFSTVYDHAKAVLSPFTAAPSPDLTAFTSRGGKLIQYHGWNDSVAPSSPRRCWRSSRASKRSVCCRTCGGNCAHCNVFG